MAIIPFLAMTAAEISRGSEDFPPLAWMACHFSPYGTGLTNLPRSLPAGSVLILNDRTPIHGHNPEEIARILQERVETLQCRGVLLDLEREKVDQTQALVSHLARVLSCPVAVSACYAQGLDCPVFLPPVPLDVPMEEYLAPWSGRELWLELSTYGTVLTLTRQGAKYAQTPPGCALQRGFPDSGLHCHCQITLQEDAASFTLWRTPEDLSALLEEAEALGVTQAVGLWQELGASEKTLSI